MKNIYDYIAQLGFEIYKIIKESSKTFSNKILPEIANLCKELPDISEERKQELEKFCDTFLSHGWVIFNYLPITVYNKELKDKKDTDLYVKKYLTKNNIENIYDSILKGGISEYNINEIKKGFTIKSYKSTALIIITLIENYIVTKYKITEKNRLQKKDIDLIKELNKDKRNNKVSIFFYLHNFSLYLAIKYLFESHDFKTISDNNFYIPNRHFLMHGFSKRNYTKKDCLCLLLILYGLIEQKDMLIKDKTN